MSIYRNAVLLGLLYVLIVVIHYYNLISDSIFMTVIYFYNLFLLVLAMLMSGFLSRVSDNEKRVLFLSLFFLTLVTIVATLTVGQIVWVEGYFSLNRIAFYYYPPLTLISSIPITGFLIWKTLREWRYFHMKHFVPSILGLAVMGSVLYQTAYRGIQNMTEFLQMELLICDITVLTLLLVLLSVYLKTESAAYFGSLTGYFTARYAADILLLNSFKNLVNYDYSMLFFAFSNIILFSSILQFYRSGIKFLSYYELDMERKRYAELFRQVSELQEVLRLINRMLRHDILNKLQIISGYIETYMLTRNDNLLEKALNAVRESSDYIDKIRELEKIVSTESGALKPVDIRKVVEEVSSPFSIPVNVHGYCVAMSDEAIYSVIENIISNAVRHGKTDRVDVWLSELEDECEIRVVDYGHGIPSGIKGQVFRESFRFGESAGSGLGLYIVKRVVERYGGKIWIEDTKPHGATFVIRLKAARRSLTGDDDRAPLKRDEGFEY
ncbi:sensor histidine kinase [Archaeoglobus neptunius]|uniref:sensor histidine kinase n=1 Tax=Archaeoglobus neptunius TaxID=2798580 RepID=UPI00192841E0|nr:HAMP domain-containing sensor histidine kinase [Archaeoglobus neptunius]